MSLQVFRLAVLGFLTAVLVAFAYGDYPESESALAEIPWLHLQGHTYDDTPTLISTTGVAPAPMSVASTNTAGSPSMLHAFTATATTMSPDGSSDGLPEIQIDLAVEDAALAEGYDLRQIANVSGHLPYLVMVSEVFTLDAGDPSLTVAYASQDSSDLILPDMVELNVQLLDSAFSTGFIIQILEDVVSSQTLELLIQEASVTDELFEIIEVEELTTDTLDYTDLGDEAVRLSFSINILDQESQAHMIFFSRDRLIFSVFSLGLGEEDAMGIAAELDARAAQIDSSVPVSVMMPVPDPAQSVDDDKADVDDKVSTFISVDAGAQHTCGVRTDSVVVCWGDDGYYGQATPPAGNFTSVSAGDEHTCGVRTDSVVVCWGDDGYYGQATPPAGNFTSVSAGDEHTCGVRTDSVVVCWGDDGYYGQATPPAGNFTSVSAGDEHTCGVRTDSVVVCWGSNEYFGEFAGQATPPAGNFTSVSAGDEHTCGVRTDSVVVCWGDDGYYGQATPPAGNFTSVSAGDEHTCGVRTDSVVVCWGSNEYFGEFAGQATPPAGNFTSVSAGDEHTCGVRTDSVAVCWGDDGYYGQATPPAGNFTSVSAGDEHTCGVRTDSVVVCWGSNEYFGEFAGQATPPAGNFTSVSAGDEHTCGVRTNGTAACWGDDKYGKTRTPDQPAPMPEIARSGESLGSFTSVSAGAFHTCGVKTDGSAICWGSNEDWFGSITGQASPPGGFFTSIDTGAGHTCGVKTDGAIECWGQNWYGQATPPGFSFASVSAGAVHTCGVKTDGAIECWGSNEDGQATPPAGNFTSVSAGTDYVCGVKTDGVIECWGNDGDTYDFFDHDRPPDGTFVSVSAGTFHTCGVKTDGAIECWGSGSSGQATPPPGNFTSVSVGYEHTCGIRTDGVAVCWGSNESIGEFIGQATPPPGNFTSVSAGYEHTCGIRTDGVAVCWGSNESFGEFAGQATPPDDPPAGEIPYDDHANTGRDATPIAVDMLQAGTLEYMRDADFFVFEAEEGRFYQIFVILDTLRDPVVALYDADVRPLVSNEDIDLIVSRTIWKAPQTEKHHVGVTGFGGDTGSYAVLVTLYVGADDYPDSVQEARHITVDEEVQGALDYHGDADVFAFEAEGGGLYQIDVSLGTLSDSMVALHDANGEELAYNDDHMNSLASLIHWRAPVSGEYYAKVTGYDIGSYALTIISDVGDDHGNRLEEASPVMVGDVVQGALDYAGDVDFFVFESEGGKSYQIDVATDTLTGYVLTKYDPDGEFWGIDVTLNPQSGLSPPKFLEAEVAGSYYIAIDGGLDGATGSYTISISTAQ